MGHKVALANTAECFKFRALDVSKLSNGICRGNFDERKSFEQELPCCLRRKELLKALPSGKLKFVLRKAFPVKWNLARQLSASGSTIEQLLDEHKPETAMKASKKELECEQPHCSKTSLHSWKENAKRSVDHLGKNKSADFQ